MAKNKLSDLNDHLFAQLERLGDEALTQEQVEKEVTRAKAINGIAKNIIDNAKTTLDGMRFAYDTLPGDKDLPRQFRIEE